MRKLAKRLGLVFVSLLATIVLGVGAVFAATFAFGAVALIVPGTGTPIAGDVDNYMQQAQKRYLQGTACADAATCDLQGIDYPASFWPLAFFPGWCRSGPDGCDKWDESVGKGTLALEDQLDYYLNETDENIVIFGYSQGGAVVSNVLSEDIAKITDPNVRKRIQIVTIGGIQTPDGGLWSRLGFLHYIPILDVTLTPPMVPVPDVQYTSYAFHFDPVADAPRYWGNPFAMLNALAALETVHGYYLTPNGNGPNETLPYGYTDDTLKPQLVCNVGVNCRVDKSGNQYIVIPATSLPIADLVYQLTPASLRPIVKPFIELVAPAFRVLAELGYDYSGDPSVATPLSLLPFNPLTFNPISFALKMAGAIVQGIVNALGGGTSLSPLNPPETAKVTTVNALSRLASDPGQDEQLPAVEDKGSVQEKQPAGGEGNQVVAALEEEKTAVDDGSVTEADAVEQDTVEQDAVGQDTVEQDAAAKLAADKAAAEQAAAAKAAADKEAANNEAAANEAAANEAAANEAAANKEAANQAADKEAAEKAAEKAAAKAAKKEAAAKAKEAAKTAREAAATEAAAKAKEAAEKAKDTAAANGVGKHDGAGADQNDADQNENNAADAGASEKTAA